MSDLNERAAAVLGWVTVVENVGWSSWQEALDAKAKVVRSGYFSPGGAKWDKWEPKKDIRQAWMLVDEVVYKRDMAFWLKQTDKGWWSCKIESWRGHVRHGADTAALAITRTCVEALEAQNG